jgi:ion channel POLLUX/CASTOR
VARRPFRNWLRARFDRTMDRGTPALIGWLGLASLALIVAVSVPIYFLAPSDNNAHGNFFYIVWGSLLRTIDTGTIANDVGANGVLFLALGFAATVGGIFIVSAFIGVLTTGMDARIQELRKGRAPIMEKGHTVILGWSDQVFTVVGELSRANQGGKRSSVVILADTDG